MTVPRRF